MGNTFGLRAARSRNAHRGLRLRSLSLSFILLALVSSARAQQQFNSPVINSLKDVPVTDTLKIAPARKASVAENASTAPPQAGQAEEEEFIKPSRPSVANPAEIHKAGVLQVEYGYDANFRSQELHTEQTAPLALRFAATSRLLLELDLDTFKSETDEATRMRETGLGDARVGLQVVALKDTAKHPALAFAYYVKLPTASEEKGLGTGLYDHKFVFLLSKKVGQMDFDFNGAYLNFGREDGDGRESGGQAAFSFSREFENNFGFTGELSGQSLDEAQPRGIYALTAATYKVNRRLQLDGGLRFGLTSDAPRAGVFAGMTVGVADFFGKGK
ncbi:MAG TPA: transporter [Pyrinomonadaceae bacterium]|nr:transporter [Pyrinomonadaceae bacterium]